MFTDGDANMRRNALFERMATTTSRCRNNKNPMICTYATYMYKYTHRKPMRSCSTRRIQFARIRAIRSCGVFGACTRPNGKSKSTGDTHSQFASLSYREQFGPRAGFDRFSIGHSIRNLLFDFLCSTMAHYGMPTTACIPHVSRMLS